MFQIKVNSNLIIEGCPDAGIEAIEFRRAHGLPESPSNKIAFEYKGKNEAACLECRDMLNASADLTVETDYWGSEFEAFAHVSPEEVAAMISEPISMIPAIVHRIAEHSKKVKEEREAANKARDAEAEAGYQADRELAAAKKQVKLEWIEKHGSPRLKRLAAEGIEFEAVYLDERLANDRPGWRWENRIPGRHDEPRNPSESAFEVLDEARKVDPNAKIRYWTDPHECDEECRDSGDCPKYDWRGYVAIAEFEGQEIVFGGPQD